MEYAVYSPIAGSHAFVLTPGCMRPSLGLEKRLGPFRHHGHLHVEQGVLLSLGVMLEDDGFETVIGEGDAHRRIASMLSKLTSTPAPRR